jgi:hypothetical protein
MKTHYIESYDELATLELEVGDIAILKFGSFIAVQRTFSCDGVTMQIKPNHGLCPSMRTKSTSYFPAKKGKGGKFKKYN